MSQLTDLAKQPEGVESTFGNHTHIQSRDGVVSLAVLYRGEVLFLAFSLPLKVSGTVFNQGLKKQETKMR